MLIIVVTLAKILFQNEILLFIDRTLFIPIYGFFILSKYASVILSRIS